MKFARFEDGRTALVVEADGLQIMDVASGVAWLRARDRAAADAISSVLPMTGLQSWVDMIGSWEKVRGAFETLVGLAEADTDGLVLLPQPPL